MIARARTALERASPAPLLVRGGVYAAGLAALLLAAPPSLRAELAVLAGLAVLAALPAAFPGGPGVTAVTVVAAAGWVLATEWYGQPVSPIRVLLLAALLYLLHTLAALAAALPYDAVLGPDALTRWLTRALAVLAASSLLSVAVLAGLDAFAGDRAYVAATLAGLALAAALATLLRRLSP